MKTHKILQYSYWLSLLCLVHCIAFPLIIAILPILGMAFEINHWLEIIILFSVLIMGSFSLIHTYQTHHKNYLPLLIFYFGIGISLYIHFLYPHIHSIEIDYFSLFFEILSGILIAGAQFYNLKITPKQCSH